MITDKSGGPAFPDSGYVELSENSNHQGNITLSGGMSLRQWYAGMALQGLIACQSRKLILQLASQEMKRLGLREDQADKLAAKCAVNYADALIAELSKPPTP